MKSIIRSFARRVQESAKLNWKSNTNFDSIVQNKPFLESLGIKHFPIEDSYSCSGQVDVLDPSGNYIGSKSIPEAKTLATPDTPDLILLESDPPLLQLANFKQTILKKIRVAQSRTMRKNIKEEFRTISINNTIKPADLSIKLSKIEKFIKSHNNVIITIPIKPSSTIELDRAHILAKDLGKTLVSKFPNSSCEIEPEAESIKIFFSPSQERDEMLEQLARNSELFSQASMKDEFKKIKRKMKKYKYTYHPDGDELKVKEERISNTNLFSEDEDN